MIYNGREVKKSDPEFFSIIGKLGAAKTLREHGREAFRQRGKLGGKATKEKYGLEHYRRIGQLHKGDRLTVKEAA